MHSQDSGTPPSGGRDGRGGRGRGQPLGRGQVTSPRGSQQGSPTRGGFSASPRGNHPGTPPRGGFGGSPPVFGGRGQATGPPFHSPGTTSAPGSRQNPLRGPALSAHPDLQPRYVVFEMGRYILASLQEARNYADIGFPVYDEISGNIVDWSVPLPSQTPAGRARVAQEDPFRAQEDEVADAEDVLAGRGKGKLLFTY
jgi:hypothetical protein